MEIFRVEDLSFRYPKAEQEALSHVDLHIGRGEFAVFCGESGCGKTTLLRLLKQELAPAGDRTGTIRYNGVPAQELDARVSAGEIGFVRQDPDSQIVTDKVWHELAFGLESLGVPTGVIRRRVGEMASYFGILGWFRQKTDELSGGQKQLLNLASVLVMQPKAVILDEPTSQLDPIAASEFIATLQKLNRELGLTILLAEHRLEEAFPIADRVVLMDHGRVLYSDTPRRIGDALFSGHADHPMIHGLPSAMRIYHGLPADKRTGSCPLTVREGRDLLERVLPEDPACDTPVGTRPEGEPALELKNVWFRYERDLPDVLRGASLTVRAGERYFLLGGNGAGKTTVLNVLSGLKKPYRGKVLIDGRPIGSYKGGSLYRQNLAFLPQDPTTVFIKDTVREDLDDRLSVMGLSKAEREARIAGMAEKTGIEALLDRHPLDLSGGERQKCALAKVLLAEPKLLLLDEPTKGLDAGAKARLGVFLSEMKAEGMTVLTVTHDVEFAAENADCCALFFDGEIVSADVPNVFFAENNFYTTAANRMARQRFPHAVTCEQVVACCKEENR